MEEKKYFNQYANCKCECDGGCNGDRTKCTSKEAIKKQCDHRCICYLKHLFKPSIPRNNF